VRENRLLASLKICESHTKPNVKKNYTLGKKLLKVVEMENIG
jgi:hypothetical protein